MPNGSALEASIPAAELSAALDGLSSADKVRLLKIAHSLTYGTGLDADDLFQESIMRALSGARRCPPDVALTVFLAGAMRSVADAERKKRSRGRAASRTAEELRQQQNDGSANSVTDTLVKIDTEAECKLLVDAIFDLFRDDEEAQLVLLADYDGLAASEIRELNGMDKTALATVRRRIRRRIQNAYPKGWTP